MSQITVTISGPVGCGKSGIAGEIEIALTAIGVPVRWASWAEEHDAKAMCGGDFIGDIDLYKPEVIIVEALASAEETMRAHCEAVARAQIMDEPEAPWHLVWNRCCSDIADAIAALVSLSAPHRRA